MHSARLLFWVLFVLSLSYQQLSCQPVIEYDGTSTVEFSGQYNWTLKYELGDICEDVNWGKVLTIDITTKTTEADLIFAFGTQSEYFAVVIAYDGRVWVPLGGKGSLTNPLGLPTRNGASFVTPSSGSALQQALVSLELQYAQSVDFRTSLITTANQTEEWEFVMSDESKTSPFALNGTQLILDIRASRDNDETFLTMFKNGRNCSIEMGSTWGYGDKVYLYMGMDGINDELFVLSGIHSVDQCSWTPRPTTGPPTPDTVSPSRSPSTNPTAATAGPTQQPSVGPTQYPTTTPSEYPSYHPTFTWEPSSSPTNVPTTTEDPSFLPSKHPVTMSPTNAPTTELTTTALLSNSPSVGPTGTDVNDQGDDEGEDSDDEDGNDDEQFIDSDSIIPGLANLFFIVIVVGGIILITGIVVIVYKYKNRTLRDNLASMDYW